MVDKITGHTILNPKDNHGKERIIEYDERGNIIRYQDANGVCIIKEYNKKDQCTSCICNAKNNHLRYNREFNKEGKIINYY